MLSAVDRFSLWGQLFEIAVKRGVLTALFSSDVKRPKDLALGAWADYDAGEVYGVLARELREVDPNQKARTRATAQHIFQLGMGLGQTAMREYLKKLKHHAEDYSVQALWCPFQLPRVQGDFDAETQASLLEFWGVFSQTGLPDPVLSRKGFPARADFLLWLEPPPQYPTISRELLCFEFSLNGLPEAANYLEPAAHLDELRRYSWFVDSRSVFSRVCAEVSGEGFDFSPNMRHHLPAFTGRDKPLYKLCQAASYIHTTMRWLNSRGETARSWNTRALSITQNGFESLAATYSWPGLDDPRVKLMETLGQAYRKTEKIPDDGAEELEDHIRFAFTQIRKALPKHLATNFRSLEELPTPGRSVSFDFSEQIEGFTNPMDELSWARTQELIGSDEAVSALFQRDARSAVTEALEDRDAAGNTVPLRDLHASAIVAGMRSARAGTMIVLGLEGNPGIGKTTAVVTALKEMKGGFLFLYLSPRVIINDDVTGNLARDRNTGEPTGVLTVTTNSKLIRAAKSWYDAKVKEDRAPEQFVDSAVVADGVENLRHPESSTLIVDPSKKEELERIHPGSHQRKHSETERQDRITDERLPGVLAALARTTRGLLNVNDQTNQVVLTAAIQGYREMSSGRTTVAGLDGLFRHPVSGRPGIQERREFAQRIPTILVMVDELTGDGAGVGVVHALADWLDKQFLTPFKDAPEFKVVLVVSDASLGNEVVLDRYLNSGERAPDKVLVSPSAGALEFRMAATPVKIGRMKRDVLHIMTNSYPASQLHVDYRVRLDVVRSQDSPDGRPRTLRRAIAEQQGDALLNNVTVEIDRAIEQGASQVIFFAQDKAFLRALQTNLTSPDDHRRTPLATHQVAILDSSVTVTKRNELISPAVRDTVKVFLMTSSGARGVSFPKTDWIIALMPRFGIEAALMEVAQLIYRGRGANYTDDDGTHRSNGDWKSRRLVMLMQDFLAQEDESPELRLWLRQVTDLLTFLVMLRSSIYTRITGDAGLEGQKLALVPVGGVGADEILSLMSSQVREFLKESDVLLRDSAYDRDTRGLVSNAQKLVVHLFSKFSLDATSKQSSLRTIVRRSDIDRFSAAASAENAPLIPDASVVPDALLPSHLYCVGPYWLEHWEHLDKEERFNIEGWLTDVDSQRQKLSNELYRIHKTQSLPGKIRAPAEELYRMLAREADEATREFSTVKSLNSPSTWLAVPVDYARFWKPGPDGRCPSLGEEDAWRDALARCLGSRGDVLPVIPRYADIPYAAVIGEQDPGRLDLVFDDRYLAASNELNLLNTILLVTEQ